MLSLNEQNICLFCNKTSKLSTDIQNRSCEIRKFIKLLQRFVSHVTEERKFALEKLLENDFVSFLNLCEGCAQNIEQFCDWYTKLKCLEMQLEWKLDKLIKVIKLGDEFPSRALSLEKILKEKFNDNQSKISESRNLIELFKQAFIQTGQDRLKLSTPRVLVQRELFYQVDNECAENINLNDNFYKNISHPDTENEQEINNDDICSISSPIGSENDNDTTFEELVGRKNDNVHNEDTQENIQDTNYDESSSENTHIQEGLLESDDLILELNDRDQILSIQSNFAEEQELNKHGNSWNPITLKAEQAIILQEKSTESEDTSLLFTTTTTDIEPSYQTKSLLTHPNKTSITQLVNQHYNLRTKKQINLSVSKDTFLDSNVFDENDHLDLTSYDYSSETTSESDDNHDDVKPLPLKTKKHSKLKSTGIEPQEKIPAESDNKNHKPFSGKRKKKFKEPYKPSNKTKCEIDPSENITFKCFLNGCRKTFYNKNEYQNHKKLHENGEFQCAFCETKETTLFQLSTHEYKRHTLDEQRMEDLRNRKNKAHPWTCPRCLQKHDNLNEYQLHFSYVHFGIGDDPKKLEVESLIKIKKRKKSQITLPKLVRENKNDISGYRCPTCKILFPTKSKLKEHNYHKHRFISKEQDAKVDIKENNTKLDVKFKCNFCEVAFEFASDLAVHEIKHSTGLFSQPKGKFQQNAARKKFQCPRCPYKYNRQVFYIKHFFTNHLNIEACTLPGACLMCSGGKVYIEDSQAHHDAYHNKNLLDEESQVSQCDECPAYFIQPFQLTIHKTKIHQSNSNHKCKICEKTFERKFNLKGHLYSVHKISDEDSKLPFGCDIEDCKKRFNTLGELDLHKKFHRNTSFYKQKYTDQNTTCKQCGKVCKSRLALSAHKYVKHSSKKFVCEECGKVFKRKGSFDMHMMYHQGPDHWKFECNVCGKKCVNKNKLDDHVRTHTKEKPFVCQFCGEKYAHRHNWRNHLKTKHGDEKEAQHVIVGVRSKPESTSFMSRKGSKKGDCIMARKSTKK